MLYVILSSLKNDGIEASRRMLTATYDMIHRHVQEQREQEAWMTNAGGGVIAGTTTAKKILQNFPVISKIDDVPMSKFRNNLIVNVVLFIILMTAYEICSRVFPSVYAGRKYHVPEDRMAIQLKSSDLPFSWVLPVMRVSWSQVRKHGGLDAYSFLRYIRMCLVITCVSGFWCMAILAPVYATAGGETEGWYHISLANVPDQSKIFWLTTVFIWLLSIYVFYVMDKEIQHYVQVRMEFCAKGDIDIHPYQRYSIMIENIPHELRSNTALYDYFNTLFPGKVHSAYVVLSIPDLEATSRRRKRVVRRLEKSIALHEGTGKRPKHIVGSKRCMCCGIESLPLPTMSHREAAHDYDSHVEKGQKVDSINYYARDLADMNDKIAIMQREKRTLANTGDNSITASQWLKSVIVGGAVQTGHTTGPSSSARAVVPSANPIDLVEHTDDGLLDIRYNSVFVCCKSIFKTFLSFFFGGFSFLSLDVFVDSVVGTTISSTGFVTFKDLVTLTCSISTPLCTKTDAFVVKQAPDPNDIQWKNLHISQVIIQGRETTTNLILIFFMFFWSVIIASIQAYANLDSLAQIDKFSWLQDVKLSTSGEIINSYLPVAVFLGLMTLLPVIFEQIALVYEDRKTFSDVQLSVLERYFNYQMLNIFVTVTASSVWDSLSTIIDDPKNVLMQLGHSVPTVVGYFISILLTRILASLPLAMLRFTSLIRMSFIKCCFREKKMTQREVDFVYRKEMLNYGFEYPMQLFVVVICFTYACITPIVLIFGALCFLSSLVFFKQQVLVAYTRIYESGGKFFPSAITRTLVGLMGGQLILMGYLLIRRALMQTLGIFPLPFLTFYMITVFKSNMNRAKQLTVDIASTLDENMTFDSIPIKHYYGKNSDISVRSASASITCDDFDDRQTIVDPYWQLVMKEPKVNPIPYRPTHATSNSQVIEPQQQQQLKQSQSSFNSFNLQGNISGISGTQIEGSSDKIV